MKLIGATTFFLAVCALTFMHPLTVIALPFAAAYYLAVVVGEER